MSRVLRLLCDPGRLEAIQGDLAELYGGRVSARYLWDVLNICVRQRRLRALVAALAALAIVGPVRRPASYTVNALDPAGQFELVIHEGRAVAATLGGTPVPERDLIQTGDTLVIRGGDNGADFRIAINPEGGITWYPRQSVLP